MFGRKNNSFGHVPNHSPRWDIGALLSLFPNVARLRIKLSTGSPAGPLETLTLDSPPIANISNPQAS
jgi:hypothetical protein